MLGQSEGGLGGLDAPDRFPASGRNAYPSGANTFFADVLSLSPGEIHIAMILVALVYLHLLYSCHKRFRL